MQIASQQVTPGENFRVFYFLRNHTDATTYYIQAKIYALDTDELLLSVPLTQSPVNPRLFSATVNAPGDQAGYGRDIVSIATVYTDSGYSSKSADYEEQEQYFLVKPQPFFGGGGGISPQDAREIFAEELEKALQKLPKPEKLTVPDAPDMSFVDALFKRLDSIAKALPKEGEPVDLKPIADQIASLSKLVEARPQFERTDLSSLAEAVQNLQTALGTLSTDGKTGNAQVVQVFEKAMSDFASKVAEVVKPIVEDAVADQAVISFAPRGSRRESKKEEQAPDVRNLTG
jgi:hypothetical protein